MQDALIMKAMHLTPLLAKEKYSALVTALGEISASSPYIGMSAYAKHVDTRMPSYRSELDHELSTRFSTKTNKDEVMGTKESCKLLAGVGRTVGVLHMVPVEAYLMDNRGEIVVEGLKEFYNQSKRRNLKSGDIHNLIKERLVWFTRLMNRRRFVELAKHTIFSVDQLESLYSEHNTAPGKFFDPYRYNAGCKDQEKRLPVATFLVTIDKESDDSLISDGVVSPGLVKNYSIVIKREGGVYEQLLKRGIMGVSVPADIEQSVLNNNVEMRIDTTIRGTLYFDTTSSVRLPECRTYTPPKKSHVDNACRRAGALLNGHIKLPTVAQISTRRRMISNALSYKNDGNDPNEYSFDTLHSTLISSAIVAFSHC